MYMYIREVHAIIVGVALTARAYVPFWGVAGFLYTQLIGVCASFLTVKKYWVCWDPCEVS